MKIVTFQYTDAKNKTTERTVLVTQTPQTNMAGIDVSELDVFQVMDAACEFNIAWTEYLEKVEAIKQEFELQHRQRNFVPERMQNVAWDAI
jgi:hypothetical protein